MNTLKTLLIAAAFVVLAFGCSTTNQREDMLSAAGFKMIPADTPQKLTHLDSLPPDKITTVNREGVLYYTFPDPKKNMLYVGGQTQYEEYQRLRLQKQMTDERLSAADMNEEQWGVWGPPIIWGVRR